MKKLFLGSIVLTFFSISIIIFQISCQKDLEAQTSNSYTLPPATTATLGGVIVGNGLSVTSNGTLSISTNSTSNGLTQLNKILFVKEMPSSEVEIWTANYDGSNAQKINIVVPSGFRIADSDAKLSPDGQTVFFEVKDNNSDATHIYTCKIDGADVKKIIDGTGAEFVGISGAY